MGVHKTFGSCICYFFNEYTINRSYVLAGLNMVGRAKQAAASTPMVVNLSLGSSYRSVRVCVYAWPVT